MQMAMAQEIKPPRGCVIVRPVSTEEQRAGSSIILLEDTRERLSNHQMFVVSVGEPSYCEDFEECGQPIHDDIDGLMNWTHPTDERIKPDAWVLIRPRSLVELSSSEKLYSVKISDVAGVFVQTDEDGKIELGRTNILDGYTAPNATWAAVDVRDYGPITGC